MISFGNEYLKAEYRIEIREETSKSNTMIFCMFVKVVASGRFITSFSSHPSP
jgi:hypothetical protein